MIIRHCHKAISPISFKVLCYSDDKLNNNLQIRLIYFNLQKNY